MTDLAKRMASRLLRARAFVHRRELLIAVSGRPPPTSSWTPGWSARLREEREGSLGAQFSSPSRRNLSFSGKFSSPLVFEPIRGVCLVGALCSRRERKRQWREEGREGTSRADWNDPLSSSVCFFSQAIFPPRFPRLHKNAPSTQTACTRFSSEAQSQ